MTDDVPLHVLAGNVVPLAKGHHMTTVDVRNSSLALLVAVPKDNAAFPAVRQTAAPPCSAARSDILRKNRAVRIRMLPLPVLQQANPLYVSGHESVLSRRHSGSRHGLTRPMHKL